VQGSSLDVPVRLAKALKVNVGELVEWTTQPVREDTRMNGQRTLWALLLGVSLLAVRPAQAQERSVWSSEKQGPVALAEVVTPVAIPPEWGALRNALPLAGDPAFYALFFEDAGGTIRILPLHLTFVAGGWQLANTRNPVAVIKRGPPEGR
jgi:hypothetical protein